MSHVYHRYVYRIVHCNADWSQSDILEIDYLEGFNDVVIEDWENSVNTNQLYTHYQFSLPNENVALKASGNYRVEVYDDEEDFETPVASFDFSVVEQQVSFETMLLQHYEVDGSYFVKKYGVPVGSRLDGMNMPGELSHGDGGFFV
jgi:hypothetical protein